MIGSASLHLGNGMQVVVIEDPRAPVVVHMVWYRVGAADEPPGESGLAHFLEHLMFKGTKTMAPGEFSRSGVGAGRQRQCLYQLGLHRLFPARRR
jgi:predicted Zn-dependent peptidase